MGLQVGDLLKSIDSNDARFRIDALLTEGRSYYIAEGADTALEDMRVILKAVKYSDNPTPQEVKDRHSALQLELEALTIPSVLLPEPLDFLQIPSDLDLGQTTEPVLVLEYQSGRTLREEIERHETGMAPQRALRLVHEIALTLGELHAHDFVFRDLNPDHIIIGLDDIIHLVGTGNIARIASRPISGKTGVSECWSAPEIRYEQSGKFLVPASDIYSLGALLSFMLTGIEPTARVESPFNDEAYARLKKLPEGYQLLVAKCIQPMAKNRFSKIDRLLPWLSTKNLPSLEAKAFAKVRLPPPFDSGPAGESFNNRASRSKISRGPLISIPRDKPQTPPKQNLPAPVDSKLPVKQAKPWYQSCMPWLASSIVFMVALLVAGCWAILEMLG